jgi:hypothetical protein
VTAVDHDHATGHVRAGFRSQQEKGSFKLLQFAEPSLRDPLDERLTGITPEKIIVELGLEISRRNSMSSNMRSTNSPTLFASSSSPV